MADLEMCHETIGGWAIVVIRHRIAPRLAVPVVGIVANAVPTSQTGKSRLVEWKREVASQTKARRGPQPWDPGKEYAISIGFSFNPGAHGDQPLDIENFVKPAIDGLAAGLFCQEHVDPGRIERFNYDDSGFVYMFIQRLADAELVSQEGAAFYVSTR